MVITVPFLTHHPSPQTPTQTSNTHSQHAQTKGTVIQTTAKMFPKRKLKVIRDVTLENELISLGVPESEVHEMTKIQQSVKYDALRKQIEEAEKQKILNEAMPKELGFKERGCEKCGGLQLCCEATGNWYCTRCFE